MAKVEVAPEPTLDAEVRLLAVESRLAALDTQQQTHQQVLEEFRSIIKERLMDEGLDPDRLLRLEQITGGLIQAVEQLHGVVLALAQARRI